jgi:lipopolysaccharide heptosyltransferase II
VGKLQIDKIRRVVVRGTNWVGDAMMTVPALRELRRVLPDAHITLATRSWAKGLFADADFIDELLPYDRHPNRLSAVVRQVSEWRRQSFDLAILFQNAFEAALIGYLARVPLRIGYRSDGRWLLLTHRLSLPDWRHARHEVFYYLNVVAELERWICGSSEILRRDPVFTLSVSSARQTEAREILRNHGARDCHPLIALCPGSINSRAKRWPYERYAALGDRLIEQLDADLLLIGSPDELDISVAVSRQMRNQPITLTGQTDLAQAVAILSVADLLVTNDTGPAHIASALGRPTLVIFGPTNPLTTRPFSAVAEIVRHPPDCAPCMLRDCPIDHRCMTAITQDEVFEHARALLSKTSAGMPGARKIITSGVSA